jgi:hypothetical protein
MLSTRTGLARSHELLPSVFPPYMARITSVLHFSPPTLFSTHPKNRKKYSCNTSIHVIVGTESAWKPIHERKLSPTRQTNKRIDVYAPNLDAHRKKISYGNATRNMGEEKENSTCNTNTRDIYQSTT